MLIKVGVIVINVIIFIFIFIFRYVLPRRNGVIVIINFHFPINCCNTNLLWDFNWDLVYII